MIHRCLKGCSTLLIIRKMQIKPTMRYHLISVRMVIIKKTTRSGIDLTQTEDIKRWQEHKELYKKDFHDPDTHGGVITHLKPDILKCEVKWTLGSIITNKPRGGDGISAKLFNILKDAAAKVLHSICQQTGKLRSGHNWKSSFFILIPKKGNAKQCSNYHTIALISHASKVMLKILQVRLQQHLN